MKQFRIEALNPGDIIFCEFPFTERDETKKRVALVISKAEPFIWCLMITGSLGYDDGHTYELSPSQVDFDLNKISVVRMNVLQTIDLRVVHRRLGKVHPECFESIMDHIKGLLLKAH
jgi:mRNA-degrading endonuclease toxin of MazEF toxin-antitoxin module